MKISKPTILVLGALLVLGAIPEVQATVIQPIGLTPQQDQIILARDGHHRHWRHHHRWHNDGVSIRGGIFLGPTSPRYYAPRQVCRLDYYGRYICRQYY